MFNLYIFQKVFLLPSKVQNPSYVLLGPNYLHTSLITDLPQDTYLVAGTLMKHFLEGIAPLRH